MYLVEGNLARGTTMNEREQATKDIAEIMEMRRHFSDAMVDIIQALAVGANDAAGVIMPQLMLFTRHYELSYLDTALTLGLTEPHEIQTHSTEIVATLIRMTAEKKGLTLSPAVPF